METGLFFGQGKKLLAIGFFLVLVAILVGGEDEPGVVSNMALGRPVGELAPPPADMPPPRMAAPAPAPRAQAADPDLKAWYANAGKSDGPVVPAPVDESHLINDTAPLVGTEPIG